MIERVADTKEVGSRARRLLKAGASAAVLATCLWSTAAQAQVTPGSAQCPVVDGTATCSGSLPSGVRVVDADDISTLIVRDLTAPIAPPAGSNGIDFRRATGPITIRTLAGPNGITVRDSANAIYAETAGDLRIENALAIGVTVESASATRTGSAAIRAVGLGPGSLHVINVGAIDATHSRQGTVGQSGAILVEARGTGNVTFENSGTIHYADVSSGRPVNQLEAGALIINLAAAPRDQLTVRNSGALFLDRAGAGIRIAAAGNAAVRVFEFSNSGDISGESPAGVFIRDIDPVANSAYRIFNSGRISLTDPSESGELSGFDISLSTLEDIEWSIALRNEGDITATSDANKRIYGIQLDSDAFVDLVNTGRITVGGAGSHNGAAGISTGGRGFRIVNQGDITAEGRFFFGGSAIYATNLSAVPGGDSLLTSLLPGRLENSATLTGVGAETDGIEIYSNGRLDLVNSGDIDVGGDRASGIFLNSFTEAVASNSGTIVSRGTRGHGVALYEISLQTDEDIADAGDAAQRDLNGSIVFATTGSIQALGLDADGVHAQSGRGDEQNGGIGDAEGFCKAGFLFYCVPGQQLLTRYSGSITVNVAAGAAVTGGSGSGAGVSMTGIGTHILDNRGTIGALSGLAVVGGVGRDTVINRGTLNGSVTLGDNDDAFILFASGNLPSVDGGVGTDLFALESMAGETFNFDLASASGLSGFELFATRGPGIVALTGTAPASLPRSIAVEAGTLLANADLSAFTADVRSGATLGGTGSLGATTVRNGGILSPGGDAVGTLTLASLFLSPGSILRYDLGRPDVVGGTDNDLVTVLGDLTLDGTLNVVQQPTFGNGVYRLFNYGGTLTDNGLVLGSGTGGQAQLQTVIAGQVNLIVGDALQFWDGTETSPDLTVDGGSGTWGGATTNWTRRNGDVNESWGGGFAVFQGTPGTVTIAPEGVSASGLQFAVGGYTISGSTLTLNAPATLRVGDGSAGGAGMTATIASTIAGTAGLDKTDLGTLILSGTNNYSGGTTISGGVLQVATDANLGAVGGGVTLNGGTLRWSAAASSARGFTITGLGGTIDAANALTLSGLIGGGGTLTKTGAGTLTLSGSSTPFAGTFALSGGALRLDGSLGGLLRVNPGTRLTGTGTLRDLNAAGTVAPGDSIGTLTATGNVTFASGSTFEVEVDPNGGSDRLLVNGTATLQGGTVSALFLGNQSGACGTSITSTILTAQGGLTGTFAGVTANYAFLTPSLSYDSNNVRLTLSRNAATFSERGATANQRSSGAAAEALRCGNPVFDAIVPLDAVGARNAFEQISGEVHASVSGALLDDSRFFRDAMLAPRQGRGMWASAYGSSGQIEGDGNAATLDRDGSGAFVGIDLPLGDSASAGIGGGYSRADYSVGARFSSAEVESWHLGATLTARLGRLNFAAGGAMAWHKLDVDRFIAFTGFTEEAGASYDGETRQLFVRAGYELPLGPATLEPFAELAWIEVRTDGFAETGGAAALSGEKSTQDALFSTLGARGSARLGRIGLTGRLGWRHAFDPDPSLGKFAFAGGDRFTISGAPISEDYLVTEAAIDIELGGGARIGIGYSGQISERSEDHGARATLRLPF